MKRYQFDAFDLDALRIEEVAVPNPGPGEVRVALRAASLNFRDLLVVTGGYNPGLPLPATPLSDGAGTIEAVGDGVTEWSVGDRVVSHFVAGWQDGAYDGRYLATTLGTPGPGLAAEAVVLPHDALLAIPDGMSFAAAATLPIAALTAWSGLVTEGAVGPGSTVLTLGTGGVSIFALQLAKALGAQVAVTSSSDAKLERARGIGADFTVNYREQLDWEKAILGWTKGQGVDVVIENGGAGTLTQSLRAVRAGGCIAMLGALTGLKAEIDIAPVLMKRVRIAGILVDSKASFAGMLAVIAEHEIEPVIDRSFAFDELRAAFEHMRAGAHFGKIVIEV